MDDATREVVHVPTHVTVLDANNRMIGTMKVVANAEIDGFADEQARAGRTARYWPMSQGDETMRPPQRYGLNHVGSKETAK